jgi:hypothetical protein
MKGLLAAILLVQTITLGVMLTRHEASHPAWQDAPIVHGPWENYRK